MGVVEEKQMKITQIASSKRNLSCTECGGRINVGAAYGWWHAKGVHVACAGCLAGTTPKRPQETLVVAESTEPLYFVARYCKRFSVFEEARFPHPRAMPWFWAEPGLYWEGNSREEAEAAACRANAELNPPLAPKEEDYALVSPAYRRQLEAYWLPKNNWLLPGDPGNETGTVPVLREKGGIKSNGV